MATIRVRPDSQAFTFTTSGKLALKLSGTINGVPNGLSFTSTGSLKATKGADGANGTGTLQNTAGNGIDNGNVNVYSTKITKIRCNSTVTRKKGNDPDPKNEGIMITAVAAHCGITLNL